MENEVKSLSGTKFKRFQKGSGIIRPEATWNIEFRQVYDDLIIIVDKEKRSRHGLITYSRIKLTSRRGVNN